ncbi:hypothetical protein EXE59_02120 [Nocardioides eburneiflavus]|uniref:Secreted protein n=1 Tax=Nocardioides eburneiflavus TaxID=2518372 RepID=A0A4Z1CI97_9ACTN|nr:hypothetical protein [Nocardioides eburneiflavus]TGN62873.1 hypothetical protein EXE59_02120 [Nocardioides eburneiflavus]
MTGSALLIASLLTAGAMIPADAAGNGKPEITSADASEIQQAARQQKSKKAKDVEDAFILEQSRQGNAVDAASLSTAEVDGAVVVWEDGVDVTALQTATTEAESGPTVEMAVESAPADLAPASKVSGNGLGVEAMTGRSGGSWNGGYCTTTVVSSQTLTQCFERLEIVNDGTSTRQTYFYNRWATATGQAVDWSTDWKPRKIDIQSRPWAGKRGDFATLLNYWPKSGQNTCSTNSFSVGVGNFSATVPVWNCEGITPEPNATNIKMGVIWSGGAVFDQRSEGADFAMAMTTFNKPAPMGDYGYAKFCKNTDANCEGVLRKDGW